VVTGTKPNDNCINFRVWAYAETNFILLMMLLKRNAYRINKT